MVRISTAASDPAPLRRTPPLLAGGLCVVAGGLLAANLPPRGWWVAGLAGFALLAVGLHGQPRLTRIALGAVAGLALFTPGLWWATDLHEIGAVVLITSQALWWALAGLLTSHRRTWAGLPAAVTLAEALRWRWPLGGLPFASPVLGQVDAPWAGVAHHGGALLVLLVGAAVGAGLGRAIHGRLLADDNARTSGQSAATTATLVTVLMVGVPLLAIPLSGGAASGPTAEIALVQGGGPRGRASAGQTVDPLARHVTLSQTLRAPDVVLWPENVIDVGSPLEDSAAVAYLRDLAGRTGAVVVAGVTESVGSTGMIAPRFANAVIAVGPDGDLLGRYDKVLRVPFGEYVPARRLLTGIADLNRVPRDAIVGVLPPVLPTPLGVFGTVISFEAMFPGRVRAAVQSGGQALLIPTNSASYRGSAVPAQQIAAARLRARETSRWVVQAAPTGYSAAIDPNGVVRASSELGAPEVLQARIELRSARTPYVRLGDWPVLLLASGIVLGSARPRSAPSLGMSRIVGRVPGLRRIIAFGSLPGGRWR